MYSALMLLALLAPPDERIGAPPTSIKLVIAGIPGNAVDQAHNGEFLLTGVNKNVGTATWTYQWKAGDKPSDPMWMMTINYANEVMLSTGRGKDINGVWGAKGNIYLMSSLPQVNGPGNTTAYIEAK